MNFFITSLSDPVIISQKRLNLGIKRITKRGHKIYFAETIKKKEITIDDAVKQIYEGISNKKIDVIMQFWGGLNTNSILDHLDYKKIETSNKIFIGYSDSTALLNTLHKKTNLRVIYGPSFISFTHKEYDSDILENIVTTIKNSNNKISLIKPLKVSQNTFQYDKSTIINNSPYQFYSKGEILGKALALNLETFSILSGTDYDASITDKILFVESAEETNSKWFLRYMTQLKQVMKLSKPRALVISKMTKYSQISDSDVINTLDILEFKKFKIPILINADFGHTNPMIPIELGRKYKIEEEYITAL